MPGFGMDPCLMVVFVVENEAVSELVCGLSGWWRPEFPVP